MEKDNKEEIKQKTVCEFIEELKKLPQDIPIIIRDYNHFGEPDHFDYSPCAEMDIFKQKVFILKE